MYIRWYTAVHAFAFVQNMSTFFHTRVQPFMSTITMLFAVIVQFLFNTFIDLLLNDACTDILFKYLDGTMKCTRTALYIYVQ